MPCPPLSENTLLRWLSMAHMRRSAHTWTPRWRLPWPTRQAAGSTGRLAGRAPHAPACNQQLPSAAHGPFPAKPLPGPRPAAPQRRLVRWRAALAGVTRAVDYCGAMLNYLVVGAAVFSGERLMGARQRAVIAPPCHPPPALLLGEAMAAPRPFPPLPPWSAPTGTARALPRPAAPRRLRGGGDGGRGQRAAGPVH